MVSRLARELAPEGCDDTVANRVLNQGLLAAGFAPVAPENSEDIDLITEPERSFVAQYRRLAPERQVLISRLLEELNCSLSKAA
jgi:hypothetical protein